MYKKKRILIAIIVFNTANLYNPLSGILCDAGCDYIVTPTCSPDHVKTPDFNVASSSVINGSEISPLSSFTLVKRRCIGQLRSVFCGPAGFPSVSIASTSGNVPVNKVQYKKPLPNVMLFSFRLTQFLFLLNIKNSNVVRCQPYLFFFYV